MPRFITWGLGPGGGNMVPPEVTVVSPADGDDISVDTPVVVDVTDDQGAFSVMVLRASFAGQAIEEVIYRDGSFASNYGSSAQDAVVNGVRFTLVRTSGWPGSPTFDADVVDTSGNKAVT